MNFSEIRGQHHVVRAIEVALTGNHNMLITGGVGMGKSMLIDSIMGMCNTVNLLDGHAAGQSWLNGNSAVVMTTRPCPCGNYLSDEFECTCSPEQIITYMSAFSSIKYSVDIFARLAPLTFEQAIDRRPSESSEIIMDRIKDATERIKNVDTSIDEPSTSLLRAAHTQLRLPTGVVFRLINVARTIAAMAGDAHIKPSHLAEAIQYRSRDGHG